MELAFAALDHGIASVADGGPLIPFAMIETPAGRTLARFVADTLEEGQARAREHVGAAADAQRAAVAYDGYLTLEGIRSDAIFVEAQERGEAAAVVFAQRYRPAGRFKKFDTVGNAGFFGTGDPLF